MPVEQLKSRPKPPSLAAHVVDELREMILSGEIGEGAQLRQDALATALDVSRIPVREALRQLEAEGLVTFVAHRGAVVSELSLEQIRELFDCRVLLEGDLLRRAIPNMRPRDFARAKEVLDTFDVSFEAGEIRVWGQLNWRFHKTLYVPADRPLTLRIVQNLSYNVDRYLRVHLRLSGAIQRARTDHRRLLGLCRKRDAEAADRCLSRHINDACQELIAFLSAHRKARAAEGGEGRKLAG